MNNRILIILIAVIFTGCKSFKSNIMFQSDVTYPFTTSNVAQEDYKIQKNDLLHLDVHTNYGYDLLDWQARRLKASSTFTDQLKEDKGDIKDDIYYLEQPKYFVDVSGEVRFPIIGTVHLENKSIRESEKLLEEKYKSYINNPFVVLKVMNRRVFVLGAITNVFTLQNENITLIELLSHLSGIPREGKSYNIKIIRSIDNNPEVWNIDLSSLTGMKDSELILKANDVIYIEPERRFTSVFLKEITPIVSIINSIVLGIGIFVFSNR